VYIVNDLISGKGFIEMMVKSAIGFLNDALPDEKRLDALLKAPFRAVHNLKRPYSTDGCLL